MRRIRPVFLSLLLGLAAAGVAFGIVRAVVAGTPQAATASSDSIAKRQHAIDREASALRKARAQRPPKLPRVPKYKRVHIPAVAAGASAPVVYKRSKPIVRYKRSGPTGTTGASGHEGDDEREVEHEDEHQDDEHEGGGGAD